MVVMATRLISWVCLNIYILGQEIFMNNNDIYDQGCWIINGRVEVIVLEAIAQTLKYQPLGFWLRLVKLSINGCHGHSVAIMGLLKYIYFGSGNIHEQ